MTPVAAIPQYLHDTYWWAYVHPNAVRLFERQWLVNLILWGNFARLRDATLAELGGELAGRTLQVACVYGDFTPRLAAFTSSSSTRNPASSSAKMNVCTSMLRRAARSRCTRSNSASSPRSSRLT